MMFIVIGAGSAIAMFFQVNEAPSALLCSCDLVL